jgi:hypothetical protein
MEKFSAEIFFHIGVSICETKSLTAMEQRTPDAPAETKALIRNTRTRLLNVLQTHCGSIGLTQSVKGVNRLQKTHEAASSEQIIGALTEIDNRIADEMGDHLFMHIPTDRASFYNQPELFGKDVNAKFPTIQFDVVEAGNCYAAGRGTAVVFHLMRIMETGVQEFGKKLGVTFTNEKRWQNILDEIDKKIKALPSKDPKAVKMSQASANLYAVKLAWRNEVMHPKDTYTLEEADNLIRQVKIFMEQLATIV